MKNTLYAAFVGLGLMLSGEVYADGIRVPSAPGVVIASGGEEYLQKILQQLNLTDAQKEKIKVFMRQIEPKFAQNIVAMNENTVALLALNTEPYNAAEIATLADAQGKLVADKIKLRMAVRHEVYITLTLDQRKQLEEMQKILK